MTDEERYQLALFLGRCDAALRAKGLTDRAHARVVNHVAISMQHLAQTIDGHLGNHHGDLAGHARWLGRQVTEYVNEQRRSDAADHEERRRAERR